jgi:hypothetical protein
MLLAGVLLLLVVRHNRDEDSAKRQHEAALRASSSSASAASASASASSAAADASAAAAAATQKAKEAKDAAARSERKRVIKALEASIKKDAAKQVQNGVLDGPVLSASCTALGGGSTDDLTAHTGTFTCLAVTEHNSDGTDSGYAFSAVVNWDDESYTWHLGN